MVSRRAFVARLAGGAVVAATAGIGRAQAMTNSDETATRLTSGAVANEIGSTAAADVANPAAEAQAQPPWELLTPLALGAPVTPDWRIAGLTTVAEGSCVLTLENERGRTQRVHLCRNGGSPQGLVYTNRIDLLVMNGGLGDLPTEEGFAQAVAEVAHVLAANENGRELEPIVGALLSHAERSERFGAAAKLR